MGVKKYIVDLATATAIEAVDVEIQKVIRQIQRPTASNVAEVVRMKSANEAVVLVGGREKTISYTGNLPKQAGSNMILNGNFGIA